MQISKIIPKFRIIIIILIFMLFIYWVAMGIGYGMLKAVYIPIGLSILFLLPYIVSKIGTFPLFCGLIFIYWTPIDLGMGNITPFLVKMQPSELGIWILCLGTLIHGHMSRSAQLYDAIDRFPFLPFVLLVAGSIIANLVSGNLFAQTELGQMRIICLLPAVICFLCVYFIKTTKQAERLLWIFLASAGILGLFFLLVPSTTSDLSSLKMLVESAGRVDKYYKLPLLNEFTMSAETTPIYFASIIALSVTIWINYSSSLGRFIALALFVVAIFIIIEAEGRSGSMATISSIIVVIALSLRFNDYSSSSFLVRILKSVMAVFILICGAWYYLNIIEKGSGTARILTLYTDPSFSLLDRTGLWEQAADIVLKNPSGVGIWGFPSSTGESWIAHNLYLFLFLSFGIVGLVGFVWFFLRYAKVCWSSLHSDDLDRRLLCIGGLGCVTALCVGGIGSCLFWSPWEVLMGWIPIGITFAVATLPEEDIMQKVDIIDQNLLLGAKRLIEKD